MNTVQYDEYKVSDIEARIEEVKKAIEINEKIIPRSHYLDSSLMELKEELEYLVNKMEEE